MNCRGTAIAFRAAEVSLNATLITTGGCRGIGRRVGGVELWRRIVITSGADAGCSRSGGADGTDPDTVPTNHDPVHGDRHGFNRHVLWQPGILA